MREQPWGTAAYEGIALQGRAGTLNLNMYEI